MLSPVFKCPHPHTGGSSSGRQETGRMTDDPKRKEGREESTGARRGLAPVAAPTRTTVVFGVPAAGRSPDEQLRLLRQVRRVCQGFHSCLAIASPRRGSRQVHVLKRVRSACLQLS